MSVAHHRQAVRPARPADLDLTARLHEDALPSGFFARLGPRFLRHYHQVFVDSPDGGVFVLPSADGPQGLLVGTFDNAAHYRWAMRQRGRRLALVGLLALLLRPRVALEFLSTRVGRYARAGVRFLTPRRRRPQAPSGPRRRVAVLTHIAVEPAARGDGAGRDLVDAFVDTARRQGAHEVRLITPVDGPGPAFYRALGWARLTRRTGADGTLVDEFQLLL